MLVFDDNKRKYLPFCLLVSSALLPWALFAGEFWVDKPPTEWSQPEVSRLLANSPWARSIIVAISVRTQFDSETTTAATVAAPQRIQHRTCCRTIDMIENNPSHIDSGSSGTPNSPGSIPGSEQELAFPAQLLWFSSQTVRGALLRQRTLAGATMEAKANALAPSSEFVIAISGQFLKLLEGIKPEELKGKTFLTARKGTKRKLPMGEYIPPQGGDNPMAFLIFPKTAEQKPVFTKEDGELEISMTGPDFKLEARFPLGPMMIRGTLDW